MGTINDIWYCIDKDYNNFQKIEFDTYHAEIFREDTLRYLEEISPKYKGMTLTKDLLGKVSGDFYVDFYQPIEHILLEYEDWQKSEKKFKKLAMATIRGCKLKCVKKSKKIITLDTLFLL